MGNAKDTQNSNARFAKPARRPQSDPIGNDDPKFARGVAESLGRSRSDWAKIEERQGDQRARVDAARLAAMGVVFGGKS